MADVTLIIPTHNRHHYLKRVLDYYSDANFRIIVADSSTNSYGFEEKKKNILYLHVPGKQLTEKLADAFELVDTDFTFMCADDDFIIPESVAASVNFLKHNEDFSTADGNIIYYKKNGSTNKKIDHAHVYEDANYSVVENDPFVRLQHFFNNYRTIFYAVHRTKILKAAFGAATGFVKNLYLNEYISCLSPVMQGKYKHLTLLYQVREFDENSDDKRTVNLDTIVNDSLLKQQYEELLTTQTEVIAQALNTDENKCRKFINEVMICYAEKLPSQRSISYNGMDKKIGKYVSRVPVIGKKIIKAYRNYKQQKKVSALVSTEADKQYLKKIDDLIIKCQRAIS